MINKSKIVFPSDDDETKLVLSKACDMYNKALNSGTPVFTKFLSPHQASLIVSRFPANELTLRLMGGYDDFERCLCLFSMYPEDDVYLPVTILSIKPRSKKTVLSHRDYMGSILALGIKRETIGDIVVTGDGAVVFCIDEISDYIIQNLTKIGNTGISITRLYDIFDIEIKREYKDISATVSSLRCDSIVSASTNLARGKASELIEKGFVTLNYDVPKASCHMLKDGDVISIRGYGKFRLETSGNLTKKGRIHIVLKKYV